jgi:hypothetical protein
MSDCDVCLRARDVHTIATRRALHLVGLCCPILLHLCEDHARAAQSMGPDAWKISLLPWVPTERS